METTWFPTEAWCLQFNSHLNKTLLFPVQDTEDELEPEVDGGGDDCSLQQQPQQEPEEESVRAEVDAGRVSQSCNPFLNFESSQEETDEKSNDELAARSGDAASSNLGNTIAVVVEEGANKIQALHKWLKGSDLKTGIRRRLESSAGLDGESRASVDLQEGPSSIPQSPQLLQRFEFGSAGPSKKRNTYLVSSSPLVAETSKQSRRTKLSNLSRTTHLSTDTASTVGSRSGSFEEPVGLLKRALPPALAESLRAMFAAFLWQEDIVHDAMACASFLKFHPLLPKNLGQLGDGTIPEDYVDTRIMMTK